MRWVPEKISCRNVSNDKLRAFELSCYHGDHMDVNTDVWRADFCSHKKEEKHEAVKFSSIWSSIVINYQMS